MTFGLISSSDVPEFLRQSAPSASKNVGANAGALWGCASSRMSRSDHSVRRKRADAERTTSTDPANPGGGSHASSSSAKPRVGSRAYARVGMTRRWRCSGRVSAGASDATRARQRANPPSSSSADKTATSAFATASSRASPAPSGSGATRETAARYRVANSRDRSITASSESESESSVGPRFWFESEESDERDAFRRSRHSATVPRTHSTSVARSAPTPARSSTLGTRRSALPGEIRGPSIGASLAGAGGSSGA